MSVGEIVITVTVVLCCVAINAALFDLQGELVKIRKALEAKQ